MKPIAHARRRSLASTLRAAAAACLFASITAALHGDRFPQDPAASEKPRENTVVAPGPNSQKVEPAPPVTDPAADRERDLANATDSTRKDRDAASAIRAAPLLPPVESALAPVAKAPNDPNEIGQRPDPDAYIAHLRALAEANPEHMRLESIGKSRAGRDLWIAILGDVKAGDLAHRPALFVATDLALASDLREIEPGASADVALVPTPPGIATQIAGPATLGMPRDVDVKARALSIQVASPDAVLDVLASLLATARTDPSVAKLLEDRVLYFAPAPDPDHVFGVSARTQRTCLLDRNFPVAWQPAADGSKAAGPYPLSEPESGALARFLRSRPEIAAVVLFARHANQPSTTIEAGANAGQVERDLAERWLASMTAPIVEGSSTTSPTIARAVLAPGSLAAYCDAFLGAPVLRAEIAPEPEGSALQIERVAGFVRSVARELPRLSIGPVAVERLRADVWLVDVPIENSGSLPSASPRLCERSKAASIWFQASGARIVAAALRRMPGTDFEPLRSSAERVFLEHLEGREQRTLRLVVQGSENATLDLAFDSWRAGAQTTSVPLL